MSGDRETELKLLCDPQDLDRVLAAAPSGDDDTRELLSVYFDTAGGTLQKAGASLRVRESGGKRVQMLKLGDGVTREEYEAPVAGDRPDPQTEPLSDLLRKGEAGALKPVFNVRVTRRQRLLRYGGALIELAADQGEVRGGKRSCPISEVELELKDGPQRALYDLARELAKVAPLYLSFQGKAARGQALAAGKLLPAARGPPDLKRSEEVQAVFLATARRALVNLESAAQVLRVTSEPAAVHRLRVSARRLRSAMATFGPMVRDEAFPGIKAGLGWIAKTCGEARQLDVFSAETLGPALAGRPRPQGAGVECAVRTQRSRAPGHRCGALRAVQGAADRRHGLAGDWRLARGAEDCPPAPRAGPGLRRQGPAPASEEAF
jgi:inorganic triphosphatase YgiF